MPLFLLGAKAAVGLHSRSAKSRQSVCRSDAAWRARHVVLAQAAAWGPASAKIEESVSVARSLRVGDVCGGQTTW